MGSNWCNRDASNRFRRGGPQEMGHSPHKKTYWNLGNADRDDSRSIENDNTTTEERKRYFREGGTEGKIYTRKKNLESAVGWGGQ